MIVTGLQIDDIPPAERFAAWRALCELTAIPMELRSDHEHDFRASVRGGVSLGEVTLTSTSVPSLRNERTAAHIRRSDPELYHLRLTLSGESDVRHGDVEATVGARQLMLTSTSTPYLAVCERGRVDGMTITLHPSLLPFPAAELNRLLGQRLSGRSGIGAMLADFLIRLAAESDHYGPADAPRLGTVAVDLLNALLAHELDAGAEACAENRLTPESRRRALRLRIEEFVRQNLRSPGLTPASIAAAHHISLRYLYRLFEEQGHTVSAWIRAQRLERCRRDLADPALGDTPIHAIAARWGFSHAADFSRAFRGAYGIPPRDFRHTALWTNR
ncbi:MULTISPECIES: helix-turn-helix domain-containing protein [Streptomyces]|uniref:Helix-turn-helix domain-containing protein n=3 Tax=Streptomyces TaxID=1883 RepID=A0ABD5J3K0_9ACTN|nr:MULTISPECIES: helix-turn-helix domain-containing protein [Streptomyces]KUL67010.1 AraC family transcriptional regulator [Streptomyces violaceusniger]MEE4582559.1 helix-turn-helix domain-containing protein [Streptomyces sp. DSM 41602]WTB11663.1 helix-turn-helix domain-containing protein [Streptomyces antimycoticus]